jgi:hypothetical protein
MSDEQAASRESLQRWLTAINDHDVAMLATLFYRISYRISFNRSAGRARIARLPFSTIGR